MKAVTGAEMRAIDRRATEEYGIPSLLLMERAALHVAEHAAAMLGERRDRRVQVVAGKGNNGGDGLAAARLLHLRGNPVTISLVADPESLQGDARVNLEIVRRLGIPIRLAGDGPFSLGTEGPLPPEEGEGPQEMGLIVDALLGTGVRGAPNGAAAAAIEAMNAAAAPVLAVDLPSGLDADTGQAPGACVQAARTVTFALPKRGLLLYPGRGLAGEIVVEEIGIPRELLEEETLRCEAITRKSAARRLPPRPPDGHKGTFGRVFLLAGSPGMTGAAALSAEAALRVGAGLVTLGVPESLNPIMEVKLTEAMTLPLAETETGAHTVDAWASIAARVTDADAVAVGPGLGVHPRTVELVRRLLGERRGPLVVDADGLNAIAASGGSGGWGAPEQVVLTPHPGEMARLLGTKVSEVESNRLAAAERAARQFGCVVVLKGAGTVVATPEGLLWIGQPGTAALATGGTGDVLTGVITGLLAQGLAPVDAAVAGVYLHARAGWRLARRVGDAGVIAGDLLPELPYAIRETREGECEQIGEGSSPC